MSSQDPTVLGLINDNLKSLNRKMDEVCLGQNDLRISDAEMKARLSAVELKGVQQYEEMHALENRFRDHYKDGDLHFNPHFSETIGEKLWRKKPEIATGGGLGALIATALYYLIEKLGGI